MLINIKYILNIILIFILYKKEGDYKMPGVRVKENESFDDAYRRFKKQCDRNLIVTETRARRFFEPMTEVRKKQKINAKKKMMKKLYMLRKYEARL
jgi:small subunit ribosomal protein S21